MRDRAITCSASQGTYLIAEVGVWAPVDGGVWAPVDAIGWPVVPAQADVSITASAQSLVEYRITGLLLFELFLCSCIRGGEINRCRVFLAEQARQRFAEEPRDE